MKIFPITSNDKRMPRIASILQGILESGNNVVIFRDIPEVWFQYYFGLYMERPTFVLVQKRDLNDVIAKQLENSLTKITVIEEFDEKSMREFAEQLQKDIKK